jgi:hypothetical protein
MFVNVSFRNTLIAVTLAASAQQAGASLMFDQDVTPDVIFGSGNANGGFTVDQSNGVELGLRGKLRHNASGQPENTFNSNGDGTYSFTAGVAPTQSFPTAVWSFEWSINSDWAFADSIPPGDPVGQGPGDSGAQPIPNPVPVRPLSALTYSLMLDTDPSSGTSFTSFDPINAVNPGTGSVQWDHAMGDNNSGNGGGTSIPNSADDASGYAANINTFNVAQNSWKPSWFFLPFDPTVDGTYDIQLAAFDGSSELARTGIQIIVGAGGDTPVPVPATLFLIGGGLLGLRFRRQLRRG